ncbi:MAG: hypothetical protein V4558_02070 [Gemmatimonadota bacterium]
MRRFRLLIIAASCGLPIHAASAQAAVVTRPDTLGAAFDATRTGKGTPTDYDFLVGSWTFRYQARDPNDGSYSPVFTGTWTAVKAHDGLVLEDEFARPIPTGGRGITMTYRVFNPRDSVWSIQGIFAARGIWQPGISWSDGHDRFLVQDNPDRHTRVRIRYYQITPNHFLWRADGSPDGGKTWMRDVMLIEATRAR